MKNYLAIIGLGGLLSACGSINYLSIDTFNPAEVTFPSSVKNVLVVNHAEPQPADWGYQYSDNGQLKATAGVRADSALVDFCQAMGESIADSRYFRDVLLYHDSLNRGRQPGEDRQLTLSQVNALCEQTGTDLILSLDRMLFDSERAMTDLGGGFRVGSVRVRVAGVVRAYLPGRATPMATIQLKDSLVFDQAEEMLPTQEESLRLAARYVGEKAQANFVPHWMQESRWYFSSSGSRWKEAAAYASSEHWDKAEQRWLQLYNSSRHWKQKAQAASNLALCAEMDGRLRKALEWATISYDLFKEMSAADDGSRQLLELYVKTLTDRVKADQKLDVQIGKP